MGDMTLRELLPKLNIKFESKNNRFFNSSNDFKIGKEIRVPMIVFST